MSPSAGEIQLVEWPEMYVVLHIILFNALLISRIKKKSLFQRLIVTAKVVNIDEVNILYDGRQLESFIRDQTGEAKINLW